MVINGAYHCEICRAIPVTGGILRLRKWDTGHVQYELGRSTRKGLVFALKFSPYEIRHLPNTRYVLPPMEEVLVWNN